MFQDFRKRWDRQSRAFHNLFRQADRVQKLAETIQRLVGFRSPLCIFNLSILMILLLHSKPVDSTLPYLLLSNQPYIAGARWFEASSSNSRGWEGIPACCSCSEDSRECELICLMTLGKSCSSNSCLSFI